MENLDSYRDTIDAYILGKLLKEEKEKFEKEIALHEELKEAVEMHRFTKAQLTSHTSEEMESMRSTLEAFMQAKAKENTSPKPAPVRNLWQENWVVVAIGLAAALAFIVLVVNPFESSGDANTIYQASYRPADIDYRETFHTMGDSAYLLAEAMIRGEETPVYTDSLLTAFINQYGLSEDFFLNLRKGDRLYAEKKYEESAAVWEGLLQLTTQSSDLQQLNIWLTYYAAISWGKAENFIQAVTFFDQSLEFNANRTEKQLYDNAEFYLILTLLKVEGKESERARALLNKVADDPVHAYEKQAKEIQNLL
ncbi:MAG: hypothetical protein AAFP89_17055 [Bacteroidota bacterium]